MAIMFDLFVDAPLPEADPPQIAAGQLADAGCARLCKCENTKRASCTSTCLSRKPFEPAADDSLEIDRRPPTRFFLTPAESSLRPLLMPELRNCRGIIYCGHGSARSEDEQRSLLPWLSRLSQVTGFPVLAEFSSNLRGDGVLGAYESWLASVEMTSLDALIRLGAPPLCARMQDFLAESQLRYHIYCSRAGEWADDSHSVTHHLTIDPAAVDAREFDDLPAADDSWRVGLADIDARAWQLIDSEMASGDFFDGAVASVMAQLMPANGAIFAGNSLPVRQLDQFAKPRPDPPLVFANRGASGIDGNVSTALGIALARKGRPTAALLGDITLYHDMNGLLALRRCGIPVTLVLLNNDGGGIFQRLPVRQFEGAFHDYFLTPHGLDFAQVAELYGFANHPRRQPCHIPPSFCRIHHEHERNIDRSPHQCAVRSAAPRRNHAQNTPLPQPLPVRTERVANACYNPSPSPSPTSQGRVAKACTPLTCRGDRGGFSLPLTCRGDRGGFSLPLTCRGDRGGFKLPPDPSGGTEGVQPPPNLSGGPRGVKPLRSLW